jgi:3-methyladenine DNA glycosylase/8-oxoguanine DNA glycosylase
VVEAEVRPPSPLRLPAGGGRDRVLRVGRAVGRLLHVGSAPVVVRAWEAGGGAIRLRAEGLDPELVEYPCDPGGGRLPARREDLEVAIARARFMFHLDEDLTPFYRRFKGDRLIGPVIRRRPWLRPRRRPWPWEALAWAITEQLIEGSRAAQIQRRIVRRWGPRHNSATSSASPAGVSGRRFILLDVPSSTAIAGRAPAELASMDLSEARSLALIRCAKETASGRADLSSPASDARLLSIREIGPWTVQCLGINGRGDPDSLPAGDLAYVKLVGRLAGLGRRATVEEVEEFFAPYAPYRGLAARFALASGDKPHS